MAYELSEQKKIGLGLIGFGIFFTFLGVLLFFDRGLLALGNILWLSGVAILLGWYSTWKLFSNRANWKGTVAFLLGLFFIFVRWPILGIVFEIYGVVGLFGGFWPSVKVFLYQIPVVGWLIQYPILRILSMHPVPLSLQQLRSAFDEEKRLTTELPIEGSESKGL